MTDGTSNGAAPARDDPPTRVFGTAAGRAAAVAALTLSGAALAMGSSAAATGHSERVGAAARAEPGAVRLGALPGATPLGVDVELRPRTPPRWRGTRPRSRRRATRSSGTTSRAGQFASTFGPDRGDDAVDHRLAHLEGPARRADQRQPPHRPRAGSASVLERTSRRPRAGSAPGGAVAFANTQAPLIGANVADDVQGVLGLDDVAESSWLGVHHRAPTAASHAPSPHVTAAGPQACPAAVTQAAHFHAYTADQFAASYNFASLYAAGDEGAGITVAVFEQEDNLASDIAEYQACYGTSAALSYIAVDGGAGGAIPNGEAAEDIEIVIGLAPKAHVDVYQAPSTLKAELDNYTAMVDRDTAQVISTSWGQCEAQSGSALLSGENTVFQQAAVQGQSIFAASGDSGSSGCSSKPLDDDDPASQPFVTGVGGTRLNAAGPPPAEVTWNASATSSGAGGGGISSSHAMPTYQSGAAASLHVLSKYSSGSPCGAKSGSFCREAPDVSADSDYSRGYLIYYNGRWEQTAARARPHRCGRRSPRSPTPPRPAREEHRVRQPGALRGCGDLVRADFHDVTRGPTTTRTGATRAACTPPGPGTTWRRGSASPNGGEPRQDPVCRHARRRSCPPPPRWRSRLGVASAPRAPRRSRCA